MPGGKSIRLLRQSTKIAHLQGVSFLHRPHPPLHRRSARSFGQINLGHGCLPRSGASEGQGASAWHWTAPEALQPGRQPTGTTTDDRRPPGGYMRNRPLCQWPLEFARGAVGRPPRPRPLSGRLQKSGSGSFRLHTESSAAPRAARRRVRRAGRRGIRRLPHRGPAPARSGRLRVAQRSDRRP